MSLQWLFYVCLTVVGSLAYNVGMKLSPPNMNAFVFALILGFTAFVIQAVLCLTLRFGLKIDLAQQISAQGIACAVAAGCAAAIIDVSYYFAMRYGSAIACQTFWTVGGIIALTICSILFFHEAITLSKAAGIVLGIVSLFLIIR